MRKQRIEYLHTKREAYKLLVALESITQAREINQLGLSLNVNEDHNLFHPIQASVIVSYGKAFTEMRPFGTISKKWTKFSEKDLQNLHNKLVYLRHKHIAHVDYIGDRVSVRLYEKDEQQHLRLRIATSVHTSKDMHEVESLCDDISNRMRRSVTDILNDLGYTNIDVYGYKPLFSKEELTELMEYKEERENKHKQ